MTAPSATDTEYAWFGALCDDDYEFLGVTDPALRSSWEHCADIVHAADRLGYDNVLLPSGYALGIDSLTFAAGIAPTLRTARLLVAVRGRRDVAAPARPAARDARSDARGPTHRQHHLERPPGRDRGVRWHGTAAPSR